MIHFRKLLFYLFLLVALSMASATAVLKLSDEILLQELFRDFDTELEALNQTERPYGVPLSISKGFAVFDAESDPDYNTVFRRADMAMYADKKAYYTTHRDRRRKYPFETEES